MLNASNIFRSSISSARQHSDLFDYLSAQIHVPWPFDDLLRGQIVIAVAAFDKFMHDIIRIGMCQCFSGSRPATVKFHTEPISMLLHSQLVNASMPPKEIIFESAIIEKLSRHSFQHPAKIAEGLSLIWDEKHKWAAIAAAMGLDKDHVVTRMTLISGRRNAIVHESDMDPLTNNKTAMTRSECSDMTDFIELCGVSIANLVS